MAPSSSECVESFCMPAMKGRCCVGFAEEVRRGGRKRGVEWPQGWVVGYVGQQRLEATGGYIQRN